MKTSSHLYSMTLAFFRPKLAEESRVSRFELNLGKRIFTSLNFYNRLMSFAGLPPTTVLASTSLVTTAPAPTTAFSPTVTPGKMVAPAPIQQLRFKWTGLQVRTAWS